MNILQHKPRFLGLNPVLVTLLLIVLVSISGQAQSPCSAPAALIKQKGETIFSAEQERYLGEAIAEQLRLGTLVYPQTELNEPLTRIAARLLKLLPENQLKKLLDASRDRSELSLVEVLSLESGETLGRILINTGRGAVRSVKLADRILFVEDNNNRTLAYSLDSGTRTGQQFGRVLAVVITGDGVLLVVRSETGRERYWE